jgi:signal peptidase II
MTHFARLSLLLATMVGCVGCDQVTKVAARTYLTSGTTVAFFYDTVRLQLAENGGAFLGLGDSLPTWARTAVFSFGGALLVAGATLWAIRSNHLSRFQTLGVALICSGGVGNTIDRLSRHGFVTDFLNMGLGPLRTGIFNVADFALLLGVATFFVSGASRGCQDGVETWHQRP